MADLNRRTFLAVCGAACACAALGESTFAADAPAAAPVDVGLLSSFSTDGPTSTFVNDHRFFVVRNEGKLYACSATCTHKRAKLNAKGAEFICPSHGTHFSIYGTVTQGPAKASLVRYAISTSADNHVLVDKSKEFSEKQWEDAGSFIEIAK